MSSPDPRSSRCELCTSDAKITIFPLDAGGESTADKGVHLCETCRPPIEAGGPLEGAHWFCLNEAVWSEHAPVQVLSYRLLHRMGGAAWATDLLDQVYLDEELLAWAQSGVDDGSADDDVVRDCNGVVLQDGDSVTLIRDLVVKGAGFTAKRGTLVKSIRLGPDPTHIQGRVNKVTIMLKTCFLKRA